MFQLINSILLEFRDCFKRTKTWRWFVILSLGFMIRYDHRGITSIIAAMRLKPRLYHTMLHFFRSTAYKVETLYDKWIKTAAKNGAIIRVANRVVTLGDHIKVSKEGLRMPGIQTLHQDSQNSGKPEFIEGHNYGQVSVVMTNGNQSRSLPLMTQRQESPPKQEGKKVKEGESLVSQMITLVHKTALSLGEPVIAALDAYFCSAVAWAGADRTVTEEGVKLVEIVTRAQTNTVAFTVPEPPTVKKRGQPRKYGDKIVLYSLFADMSKFKTATMMLYGKQTEVKYLCLDLIWKPVKKLVRFVLVETDRGRCVLMSSSLTIDPQDIITIYALRFKIETSFGEQKNDLGCFAYHFWTTALPKRKKWKKAGIALSEPLQKRIENTKRAMESYVCLSTIAAGILTIIAFSHNREIWNRYPGWIRTRRSSVPTAATVKSVLTQDFHASLPAFLFLPSFNFILPLLRPDDFLFEGVA